MQYIKRIGDKDYMNEILNSALNLATVRGTRAYKNALHFAELEDTRSTDHHIKQQLRYFKLIRWTKRRMNKKLYKIGGLLRK